MMPYVSRDTNGKINGRYSNAQEGYADEWIEDDSADLLAYLDPPPTPQEVRAETFKSDAGRTALVNRLRTATPQQIETYFQGRTTLAQLKQDLVDIVKVLALEVRD